MPLAGHDSFVSSIQKKLQEVSDSRAMYPELFALTETMGVDVKDISIIPPAEAGPSWNDHQRVCLAEVSTEILCNDARSDFDKMEERVRKAVSAALQNKNNGVVILYRMKTDDGCKLGIKIMFDGVKDFKKIVPSASEQEFNKLLSSVDTGVKVVASLKLKVIPTWAAAVMEDMMIKNIHGSSSQTELLKMKLGDCRLNNGGFAVDARLFMVNRGDVDDVTGQNNQRLFGYEFTLSVAQMLVNAFVQQNPGTTPEKKLQVTKKYFYDLWDSVKDMWNPSQIKKNVVAMYVEPMISYCPKGAERKNMEIVYESRRYGYGPCLNLMAYGKNSSMELQMSKGCSHTVDRGISVYTEGQEGVYAFEFEPTNTSLSDALAMGEKKDDDDMAIDEDEGSKMQTDVVSDEVMDNKKEGTEEKKKAPDMEIGGIPVAMPPGLRRYLIPTATSLAVGLRLEQPQNQYFARTKGAGATRGCRKSRGRSTKDESEQTEKRPAPNFKAMVCNVKKGSKVRDLQDLSGLNLQEDTKITFGPAVATLVPCVDIQQDMDIKDSDEEVDADFTANLVHDVVKAIDLIASDITTAVAYAGSDEYKTSFARMCDNQALQFDGTMADDASKSALLENVNDAKRRRIFLQDPMASMASMACNNDDNSSVDDKLKAFLEEESNKHLKAAQEEAMAKSKELEEQKTLAESAKQALAAASDAAKASFYKKTSPEECAQEVDDMLKFSANSDLFESKIHETMVRLALKVTARDDKDDDGEVLKQSAVNQDDMSARRFKIPYEKLIYFTFQNKGDNVLTCTPVYYFIEESGGCVDKEYQDRITLKQDEENEMQFPVQWRQDETMHELGWIFEDESGKEFLRVRFTV